METTQFADFSQLPMGCGDPHRSVKTTVVTDVEDLGRDRTWLEVVGEFGLADGRSIANLDFSVSGVRESETDKENMLADIAAARKDLAQLKAMTVEFVDVSLQGLDDIEAELS